MVPQRLLIGEIDPHRILLVELHQRLVDNHASRTPERLVQNSHHIVKLGWNLRLWNTPLPQMIVHNITDTRAHSLQCRLEAVGHRILESRDQCGSQSSIPTQQDYLSMNTDDVKRKNTRED